MIGELGDVAFEVSSEKIRTFDGMSFTRQARYATHDIIGSKSLLEFTGLSPATCSMKIMLHANLGVDPLEELTILRNMLNEHKAVNFTLDGEPQGDGKWVLESLNESHTLVDNKGHTLIAEATLSLKEYLEAGTSS